MVENQSDLEQILEEGEGLQFRYKPINPKNEYDRREFLIAQEQLNDLNKYNEALGKDVFNLKAREKLFEMLLGDKRKHMLYSPEKVRKFAKEALDDGIDNMGRYVEDKREIFMDMLDGEDLFALSVQLPLYKNEHKEHDEMVDLINEVKYMENIAKEKDLEKMTKIVLKKAESKAVPDWAKKIIKYFAGDPNFVKDVYGNDLSVKQNILIASLSKDGKRDKDKLGNLIRDSLDKAYEMLDDEDNTEDEKNDIWKECIRPYYLEIANSAFEKEKKEFEDEDENKNKENERKAERSEIGMAA